MSRKLWTKSSARQGKPDRPQSSTARVLQLARSLLIGKDDYVQDLAADSDSGLVKLSQRRKWLLAAFVCGLTATAIMWIAALHFPFAVSAIYSYGVNSNLPRYGTLLSVILMSIPFAPPFISVFALSNLMFPSPQTELTSGVMSTFEYGQKSNKQWAHNCRRRNVWGPELHPAHVCNLGCNWELVDVQRSSMD
ncbi:MAG TPA: hypothetical protein VK557_04925, partial [Pyrinomonadaceae bacterium]|nr:hypothetical protein [Pyrinomonadaceae bacterium]